MTYDPTAMRSVLNDMREQITALMLEIDEKQDTLEIGAMISVAQILADLAKQMSTTSALLRLRAAQQLQKRGVKNGSVVGWNGEMFNVEVQNSPTRTSVKRDDLLRAVEQLLLEPTTRMNQATGEIADYNEALLATLKSAFRLEPRWAEISKLGIQDDEYCQKSWNPTLKISEAEAL